MRLGDFPPADPAPYALATSIWSPATLVVVGWSALGRGPRSRTGPSGAGGSRRWRLATLLRAGERPRQWQPSDGSSGTAGVRRTRRCGGWASRRRGTAVLTRVHGRRARGQAERLSTSGRGEWRDSLVGTLFSVLMVRFRAGDRLVGSGSRPYRAMERLAMALTANWLIEPIRRLLQPVGMPRFQSGWWPG